MNQDKTRMDKLENKLKILGSGQVFRFSDTCVLDVIPENSEYDNGYNSGMIKIEE